MAREAQDREHLLRDATAFPSRVQLKVRCGERTMELFAGFRENGAASLYFDQDPVYHFNRCGQLRRAFVDNTLVKAERGRLVSWTRQRGEAEVAMIREEKTIASQQLFCETVLRQLSELHKALDLEEYRIEGQVHSAGEENVVERLLGFLDQRGEIEIADSPRVTD